MLATGLCIRQFTLDCRDEPIQAIFEEEIVCPSLHGRDRIFFSDNT